MQFPERKAPVAVSDDDDDDDEETHSSLDSTAEDYPSYSHVVAEEDRPNKKTLSSSSLMVGLPDDDDERDVKINNDSNNVGVTEYDIQKIKDEIQKHLEEEQLLLSAQMQLLLQLEKVNSAIISAESDERLAKLALQQAQVHRLLKKQKNNGQTNNGEEETVTIEIRS